MYLHTKLYQIFNTLEYDNQKGRKELMEVN